MKTEKQLLYDREIKAESLGEGSWYNPRTKEWCFVEVTFYPLVKLWITEAGQRREIHRDELCTQYRKLQLD